MVGIIYRVFPERGFGFIRTEDSEEFFFHASELRETTWDEVVNLVNEEKEPLVYFTEVKHSRGPRAIKVELVKI